MSSVLLAPVRDNHLLYLVRHSYGDQPNVPLRLDACHLGRKQIHIQVGHPIGDKDEQPRDLAAPAPIDRVVKDLLGQPQAPGRVRVFTAVVDAIDGLLDGCGRLEFVEGKIEIGLESYVKLNRSISRVVHIF